MTQFEDLQSKGISSLANIGTTADSTKNTMKEIDSVRYDSFGQAIQGIGRQLMMGLFDPFNEKVMPKVNEFAQWVTDHMPQIQSGIETAMGVASKAFDDLKNAVKWVIDNFNILAPIIAGITGAIIAQMVIDKVVALYKAWKLVTAETTTMQWLLNAAMNANPIGLVALAIGALIAVGILLWKNWDTVKAKAGELWSSLKSIFGKIGDFLSGVWNGMSSGLKSAINSIIGAINGMIGQLNKIKIHFPDWIPKIGGTDFGFNVPKIPMLAKGGRVLDNGAFIAGEAGAELISGAKGATVTPLDKVGSTYNITINANNVDMDEKELMRSLQRLEVLYG